MILFAIFVANQKCAFGTIKPTEILCMNGWRRKETDKESEWKSKNFENPTYSFTLKSWAFHLNCVITNGVWLNSFKYPYHCWYPSVRSFLPVYVRFGQSFPSESFIFISIKMDKNWRVRVQTHYRLVFGLQHSRFECHSQYVHASRERLFWNSAGTTVY